MSETRSETFGAGWHAKISDDAKTLIIQVDLTAETHDSKTGKSIIIASSGGFKNLAGDLGMNLLVTKRK